MAKRKKQTKSRKLKFGCDGSDFIAGPCSIDKTPEERCIEAIKLLQRYSMNPFGLSKENVQEFIDTISKELNIRPPADAVNNPSHYGGKNNPYEAIKVIRAWDLGFSLGNAVKYISRAGKKDPGKHVEDLEKAIWYIQEEIDTLKNDHGFAKAE